MFSNIFLNKQNLLDNLNFIKSKTKGKICLMVKANAYGHGDKEIVAISQDNVDFYGVSNQHEALNLKKDTKKPIMVFGRCNDYKLCMQQGIHFVLLSLSHAKEIVKIYKETKFVPYMHLCINTGMNRYGVRDISECKRIVSLLQKNGLKLEGVYTHFSSLTSDRGYTSRQNGLFEAFKTTIPKDWNCIFHVGGGRSVLEGIKADMYRIGLYAYGYGCEKLKGVMSVESEIVDIQQVKKGEHVGYLCGFTATKNMTVATIPLGYADGLPRKLSNKLNVKIKGKKVINVGNICMDAFMVDVSKLNCKIGDKVVVFDDASEIATLIESTEYEVLTNMTKFRGERKVL